VTRTDDLRRIEQAITRIQRISLGRDAVRRRADRAGVNLGRPAVAVLFALYRHGPQRLSDLARHTQLEAPLISREVRALVEDGYVTRRADPADGRATIVELTEFGRESNMAYRKAVDEIIAETFDGWTAKELAELAASLERVARDFAAYR
jgi:DNA-binding MarR family transcriptional regulator